MTDSLSISEAALRGGYSSGINAVHGQMSASREGGEGLGGSSIHGATITTSSLRPGANEQMLRSPDSTKQFQSPSSTAFKMGQSRFDKSYDMSYDMSGISSQLGTPGSTR